MTEEFRQLRNLKIENETPDEDGPLALNPWQLAIKLIRGWEKEREGKSPLIEPEATRFSDTFNEFFGNLEFSEQSKLLKKLFFLLANGRERSVRNLRKVFGKMQEAKEKTLGLLSALKNFCNFNTFFTELGVKNQEGKPLSIEELSEILKTKGKETGFSSESFELGYLVDLGVVLSYFRDLETLLEKTRNCQAEEYLTFIEEFISQSLYLFQTTIGVIYLKSRLAESDWLSLQQSVEKGEEKPYLLISNYLQRLEESLSLFSDTSLEIYSDYLASLITGNKDLVTSFSEELDKTLESFRDGVNKPHKSLETSDENTLADLTSNLKDFTTTLSLYIKKLNHGSEIGSSSYPQEVISNFFLDLRVKLGVNLSINEAYDPNEEILQQNILQLLKEKLKKILNSFVIDKNIVKLKVKLQEIDKQLKLLLFTLKKGSYLKVDCNRIIIIENPSKKEFEPKKSPEQIFEESKLNEEFNTLCLPEAICLNPNNSDSFSPAIKYFPENVGQICVVDGNGFATGGYPWQGDVKSNKNPEKLVKINIFDHHSPELNRERHPCSAMQMAKLLTNLITSVLIKEDLDKKDFVELHKQIDAIYFVTDNNKYGFDPDGVQPILVTKYLKSILEEISQSDSPSKESVAKLKKALDLVAKISQILSVVDNSAGRGPINLEEYENLKEKPDDSENLDLILLSCFLHAIYLPNTTEIMLTKQFPAGVDDIHSLLEMDYQSLSAFFDYLIEEIYPNAIEGITELPDNSPDIEYLMENLPKWPIYSFIQNNLSTEASETEQATSGYCKSLYTLQEFYNQRVENLSENDNCLLTPSVVNCPPGQICIQIISSDNLHPFSQIFSPLFQDGTVLKLNGPYISLIGDIEQEINKSQIIVSMAMIILLQYAEKRTLNQDNLEDTYRLIYVLNPIKSLASGNRSSISFFGELYDHFNSDQIAQFITEFSRIMLSELPKLANNSNIEIELLSTLKKILDDPVSAKILQLEILKIDFKLAN